MSENDTNLSHDASRSVPAPEGAPEAETSAGSETQTTRNPASPLERLAGRPAGSRPASETEAEAESKPSPSVEPNSVPAPPAPATPAPEPPTVSEPAPELQVQAELAPSAEPAPEPVPQTEPAPQPEPVTLTESVTPVEPERASAVPQTQSRESRAVAAALGLDETYKDPLLRAPRRSSVVLCVVLGALFIGMAALMWWETVRTTIGQQYDDLVWETFKDSFPVFLAPIVNFFTHSTYVIAVIVAIGIVSVIMVIVRHRWRLLVQLVAFALVSFLCGYTLKRILPRTSLDPSLANPANSSPSGHSVAAFAAAVVLILAVPLSLRSIAAVVSFIFATSVGLSVVVEKWHRPSDVIVAFLLVTGLALITLAFTRASGMDKAGARRSSPSLQILATAMIVAGVFGTLFAGYLVWNIVPGLGQEAAWTVSAAQGSALLGISGISALSLGTILAMRQITASPLSTIGRVGAPPAPPVASQPSSRR